MSMHNYLLAALSVAPGAILVLRLALLKWKKNGGRAAEACPPPGSRGLPFLGGTLQFFAASPTLELPPFFKQRLDRYIQNFRHDCAIYIAMDDESTTLHALMLGDAYTEMNEGTAPSSGRASWGRT